MSETLVDNPPKTLKIAVQGAATIPLDALEPFQGELKRLDRADYEGLRNTLIDEGFSFTIHVWQNEGHNYIIDGHQRLAALKQMREQEQWQIPELPVSIVFADDFAKAKRKVLAGASTYGRMSAESLYEFAKANDIQMDEILKSFRFPEVNTERLMEFFGKMKVEELPTAPDLPLPEMRSAGEGVQQVQLFFDSAMHAEFVTKVDELSRSYGKENITDTVMEAVREAYSAKFPAQ